MRVSSARGLALRLTRDHDKIVTMIDNIKNAAGNKLEHSDSTNAHDVQDSSSRAVRYSHRARLMRRFPRLSILMEPVPEMLLTVIASLVIVLVTGLPYMAAVTMMTVMLAYTTVRFEMRDGAMVMLRDQWYARIPADSDHDEVIIAAFRPNDLEDCVNNHVRLTRDHAERRRPLNWSILDDGPVDYDYDCSEYSHRYRVHVRGLGHVIVLSMSPLDGIGQPGATASDSDLGWLWLRPALFTAWEHGMVLTSDDGKVHVSGPDPITDLEWRVYALRDSITNMSGDDYDGNVHMSTMMRELDSIEDMLRGLACDRDYQVSTSPRGEDTGERNELTRAAARLASLEDWLASIMGDTISADSAVRELDSISRAVSTV